MAIDFLNPLLNISKGIGIGHVVYDDNPMCASIVGGCDAVRENPAINGWYESRRGEEQLW